MVGGCTTVAAKSTSRPAKRIYGMRAMELVCKSRFSSRAPRTLLRGMDMLSSFSITLIRCFRRLLSWIPKILLQALSQVSSSLSDSAPERMGHGSWVAPANVLSDFRYQDLRCLMDASHCAI